jgi:glutamine phosphoribosylpyrophosphate amidotransferase
LVYLPLDKLIQSCLEGNENGPVKEFETGIFTGDYVTGGHEEYIQYVKRTNLARKAASQVKVEVLGKLDMAKSMVECFPIS